MLKDDAGVIIVDIIMVLIVLFALYGTVRCVIDLWWLLKLLTGVN